MYLCMYICMYIWIYEIHIYSFKALGSVNIATDNNMVLPNNTRESSSDKEPLLGEKRQQLTTCIYVRTVVAGLFVLDVLAASILIRIFVPTKESIFRTEKNDRC